MGCVHSWHISVQSQALYGLQSTVMYSHKTKESDYFCMHRYRTIEIKDIRMNTNMKIIKIVMNCLSVLEK